MRKKRTLAKLLSYIGSYVLIFIVSLIATALSVICSLYIPITFGQCVDLLIKAGDVNIDLVLYFVEVMILLIVIGALSGWAAGVLNNIITFKITKKLRARMFNKISELSLFELDAKTSGELLSRCVTDIEQISDGFLLGFSQLFHGIFTIIGTIIFMMQINVWITIAVAALMPASFALAKFIASRSHAMFAKQSESRGDVTSFTDEAIENMKLIYAFGHKDESRAEFDAKRKVLAEYTLKSTFYSSLVNPSTRIIYSTLYAVVTLIGGYFAIGGAITVGALSALLGYTNQYSKPFNEITGTITEFQNALASAARVFEILEIKSEENLQAEYNELISSPGAVEFDNVSFSYDTKKPLIKNFYLNVLPGQRVAIVGPTGSGKTTLINLLMRFYDVNEGVIRIDGRDIRDMSHQEVRAHFGMVLQDIWLKAGTISENISYGYPNATIDEIRSAAENAYAADFIEKLPRGYDTYIGEDGGSLSEGQKQLLCIARVMLGRMPILILDEATSSVDSMTEIRITKAFDKLMEGRTSFVVAHRLSTIENADLIIVMNNGSIIEQGTHEQLLNKKGFYYGMYRSI